jgi:hypothetical protein
VPRPPPGELDRLLAPNRHLGIDATTCRHGDGDPMDLHMVVTALYKQLNASVSER